MRARTYYSYRYVPVTIFMGQRDGTKLKYKKSGKSVALASDREIKGVPCWEALELHYSTAACAA